MIFYSSVTLNLMLKECQCVFFGSANVFSSVGTRGVSGRGTKVHCIYNARVSAFFYRYASEGRGGDQAAALALMDSIWRPGGVWADFIGKPADSNLPNRYAGDDY